MALAESSAGERSTRAARTNTPSSSSRGCAGGSRSTVWRAVSKRWKRRRASPRSTARGGTSSPSVASSVSSRWRRRRRACAARTRRWRRRRRSRSSARGSTPSRLSPTAVPRGARCGRCAGSSSCGANGASSARWRRRRRARGGAGLPAAAAARGASFMSKLSHHAFGRSHNSELELTADALVYTDRKMSQRPIFLVQLLAVEEPREAVRVADRRAIGRQAAHLPLRRADARRARRLGKASPTAGARRRDQLGESARVPGGGRGERPVRAAPGGGGEPADECGPRAVAAADAAGRARDAEVYARGDLGVWVGMERDVNYQSRLLFSAARGRGRQCRRCCRPRR